MQNPDHSSNVEAINKELIIKSPGFQSALTFQNNN